VSHARYSQAENLTFDERKKIRPRGASIMQESAPGPEQGSATATLQASEYVSESSSTTVWA
jgi:hypothetical protein